MTSDSELTVNLRRLLRVRSQIVSEGDTVPAELDAKIEEVVGRIEAGRQTTVMGKNQTQRQIPSRDVDRV